MKVFDFDIFLFNRQKKHFNKFWRKSVKMVQSHSNFMKNEVALNPVDRIFWKFAEMFSLTIKQKYIKNKNFRRVVFEL